MKLLSQSGYRYYTSAWGKDDITSFLKSRRNPVAEGEVVGIYSAPKDGPRSYEFEDLTLRGIAKLGYTPTDKPDPAQLAARLWAESWRSCVELIRECGGKPVVILFAEHYKTPQMAAELAQRLDVELISREEWVARGGEHFG